MAKGIVLILAAAALATGCVSPAEVQRENTARLVAETNNDPSVHQERYGNGGHGQAPVIWICPPGGGGSREHSHK
jgi:hypothetical protein